MGSFKIKINMGKIRAETRNKLIIRKQIKSEKQIATISHRGEAWHPRGRGVAWTWRGIAVRSCSLQETHVCVVLLNIYISVFVQNKSIISAIWFVKTCRKVIIWDCRYIELVIFRLPGECVNKFHYLNLFQKYNYNQTQINIKITIIFVSEVLNPNIHRWWQEILQFK